MGIRMELLDTDAYYKSLVGETVVVNDLSNETVDEKKHVNSLLFVTSGNVFDNIPQCQCGHTKGKTKLGVVCKTCYTPVEETRGRDLQSYVWIRKPEGVRSLINVTIFLMLREYFEKDGGEFDVIQYLTNPHYKTGSTSKDTLSILQKLHEHPTLNKRGLNFFIDHFDEFMFFLFNQPEYRKDNQKSGYIPLWELINRNRDILFPEYIPVPNKSLLVVEETPVASYIDTSLADALSGIRMLIGIDNPNSSLGNLSVRSKEARVAKCLVSLTNHYVRFYSDTIGGKPGITRRLILGTRCDYSFRTVITSLTGPHRYDEIHIPWSVGMVVFRLHLFNKLSTKFNWHPMQINQFLNRHVKKYHPVLDAIFKELIAEAGGGVPALMNRNPSLGRGSLQRVFITLVKTDVNDNTTGMSILNVRGFNADFDGDALNFLLLLDEWAANEAQLLAPELNILDLDDVYSPSGITHIPKPVAANIANWLDDWVEPANDVQIYKMAELAA